MTTEERERMNELCRQIQAETDHREFSKLVLELSVLLEQRGNQLQEQQPNPSGSSPASGSG